MGISDIRKVTTKLTSRAGVVLNSHTHDTSWRQLAVHFLYGMDTELAEECESSREDAQAEIAPDQLCGDCKRVQSKTMRQNRGEFRISFMTASRSILAANSGSSRNRPHA